jgi:hypothetical protein
MNCVIIGAGQLGSRHLQGLLSFQLEVLQIFMVDPSNDALETAKLRAQEIPNFHKITFLKEMTPLPSKIDFAVIATNSNVRLQVLEELTLTREVEFLVLEKVLFPEISQYESALELVKKKSIHCWVNHARRMFDDYHNIQAWFNQDKTYCFQVSGVAWGLACNGLHFIDLFEYLTQGKLTQLSTELVHNQAIESKRNGFVEFEGSIRGVIDGKHAFLIQSLPGNQLVAPALTVMTDDLRLYIQESGNPLVLRFSKELNFSPVQTSFTMQYQSQLTGKIVEQLKTKGTCDLPTLEHACSTHKIFVGALLDHWNKSTSQEASYLPIT